MPAQASFAYHRSLAPMMWVLAGLIVVEGAVVHLLIALWSPVAALALSVLSVLALAWLVMLIRSFRTMPVEIGPDGLLWRCGTLRAVTVPLVGIAGLRAEWDGALVKDRATLNLALIAWPNIVIDLAEPFMLGRRRIERLAHKLDDREAFVAALSPYVGASLVAKNRFPLSGAML